jgi:hypothetical protein
MNRMCGRRAPTAATASGAADATRDEMPEQNAHSQSTLLDKPRDGQRDWTLRQHVGVACLFLVVLWLACLALTALAITALLRVTEE